MFTSSNNNINNGVDPVSYNDQQRPFFNDIIPSTNPKPDDLPFPFFYLPSPLFPPYELELEEHGVLLQQEHDLFLHHQPLSATTNTCVSETILNMVESGGKEGTKELAKVSNKRLQGASEQIPIRRRSSKRDRHSKINTAQGPRDRRMRLSLKVAREFFDVQDKLGFDKASKTVEWLLIQSKPAIEKLFSGLPKIMNSSCKSVSSTSECEVVSGIDEGALKVSNVPKGKPSPRGKKERKTRSSSRKTTSQVLGRESRDMRRARARVRTLEKWSQKLDESKLCEEATNCEMFQLGSWSAFETGEESGTQSYNVNPPSSLDAISHKQDRLLTAEGLIDDSLVVMSKWSPSPIFNPLQNTGVPQELHFTEFQPFCKPW